MCLYATASGEVAQTLAFATSEQGLDREMQAAQSVLRVRTGPECPVDNLRELTWDSNPNCGIAREEKKRTFPQKTNTQPDLLTEQRTGQIPRQSYPAVYRLLPPPCQGQRGRHATARAKRQGATPVSAPETSIFHQILSRLPVANHIFLGSWTAVICQEVCSLKSAPQRRHMSHLRWCSYSAPGKPSGWDQGGD